MSETPFLDHAIKACQPTAANRPGGVLGLDTPHRACLLALAGLAERDLRTGDGVRQSYSALEVSRLIGRAESTTKGYLNLLADRGLVAKRHSGHFRPLEAS